MITHSRRFTPSLSFSSPTFCPWLSPPRLCGRTKAPTATFPAKCVVSLRPALSPCATISPHHPPTHNTQTHTRPVPRALFQRSRYTSEAEIVSETQEATATAASAANTLHAMQYPTGATPPLPVVGSEEQEEAQTDTSQATVEPPTASMATLTTALDPRLKVRRHCYCCCCCRVARGVCLSTRGTTTEYQFPYLHPFIPPALLDPLHTKSCCGQRRSA